MSAGFPPRRRHDQRGSASVELVILVPALVLVLGLLVAGGRLWFARATVVEGAESAARAASLARSPGEARAAGKQAAARTLATDGLSCGADSVSVDTSAFGVPVGTPATVTATVTCRVTFADLDLPGMPGSITVRTEGAAALDTYRARS
ncbi:MAG TPA: TadE/TadG family type IV pilus assembly protein [Microlunatus sp.]|nr:TadE/TadG family type IV pilus assembly protein [Microlunatus sp.]